MEHTNFFSPTYSRDSILSGVPHKSEKIKLICHDIFTTGSKAIHIQLPVNTGMVVPQETFMLSQPGRYGIIDASAEVM